MNFVCNLSYRSTDATEQTYLRLRVCEILIHYIDFIFRTLKIEGNVMYRICNGEVTFVKIINNQSFII